MIQPSTECGRSPNSRTKSPPYPWIIAIVAATVLAAGPPFGVPSASADSLLSWSSLPSPLTATSAVVWGNYIYVFGGSGASGYSNQILSVDLATGVVSPMNSVFAAPLDGTSVAMVGDTAFIVGGESSGGPLNQIVRYHVPFDDGAWAISNVLPSARSLTSSVSDGQYVYIFGGRSGAQDLDQIVRFNLVSETSQLMNAKLPQARCCTSAVWDGQYAYIFGGATGCCSFNGKVLRYHPPSDTLTELDTTLTVYGSSALWVGAQAVVFGPNSPIRFDPSTSQVVAMSQSYPSPRSYASSVWTGGKAYVIGGHNPNSGPASRTAQILRYTLEPGPPQGAVAGTSEPGEIVLTWEAPSPSTYVNPPTSYRVYAGDAAGQESFAQNVGLATSYEESGLAEGRTRYFRVSAVNPDGESPLSAEVSATTPLACLSNACISIKLVSKIGDVVAPAVSVTPAASVEVKLERGQFRVDAAGGFVARDLVVPRANGLPNPALLNQTFGAASTSYAFKENVCVQGICEFVIGATAAPGSTKVGEAWNAQLQEYEDGQPLMALPMVIVKLT